MKASKRILSMVLAILMVVSVCSVGFTANAVDVPSGATLEEVKLEPVSRPQVEFTCTPITRVAKAVGSVEPGETIVKSTPSGVPELSGPYVQQAYAGETPVQTTVTFTSYANGIKVTGISCNNEAVVLSDLYYVNGSYVATVESGTVPQNEDGTYSPLVFTVDYTWDDGNAYQQKCVSYVESIATGGSYVAAESEIQSLAGTSSFYRVYAAASTRLLGKGVYYEMPSSVETSTEDPYRQYGVYDVSTGTIIENVSSGYNTSLFKEDKIDKPAGNMNQANELSIPGTTLAHVYVDASESKTLADQNIRLDSNVGELSDRNNSNPYTALADMWVSAGSNTDALVTTNDTSAQSAIGLDIPAKADYGVTQYEKDTAMETLTAGVGQYGNIFTTPLTGNVANLVDGSAFTVTLKYYAYMWVNGGVIKKFNMTSSATVPVSMTFHIVDKSVLRETLDYVMNTEPDVPTSRAKTKGANPQAWYYSSGFSAFQTNYVNALNVLNNPKAAQTEIDAAANSLNIAYKNLKLNNADYKAVNSLKTEANMYIKNADAYTAESIALLKQAVDGVVTGYTILYQDAVDTMARNLQAAIDNLQLKPADYSVIEGLQEEFDAIDKSLYTTDSIQAVEDAFAVVVYGKYADEQPTVDAWADEIRNAIDALRPLSPITDINIYYNGEIAPEYISVNVSTFQSFKSSSIELTYDYAPVDAKIASAEWSSSNENVSCENGVVKPNKNKPCGAAITLKVTDYYGNQIEKTVYVAFVNYEPTGVTIDKTKLTVPYGAENQVITATVLHDTTDYIFNSYGLNDIIWRTSDPNVATVENGVVTFREVGTCQITATTLCGGYTATCLVIVSIDKSKLREVIANADEEQINIQDYTYETYMAYVAAYDHAKEVEASDLYTQEEIDDATERLTNAINALEPYIHVESIIITPDSDKNITVNGDYITYEAPGSVVSNKTIQLNCTLNPENAMYETIEWASSNASKISVDQNGLVKSLTNTQQAAAITITITDYYGVKYVKTVHVSFVKWASSSVTGVSISHSEISGTSGGNFTLTHELEKSGLDEPEIKDVIWTSSNEKVATVNAEGKVFFIDSGECTITVTTVQGGFTASCKVTVKKPFNLSNLKVLRGTATMEEIDGEEVIVLTKADGRTMVGFYKDLLDGSTAEIEVSHGVIRDMDTYYVAYASENQGFNPSARVKFTFTDGTTQTYTVVFKPHDATVPTVSPYGCDADSLTKQDYTASTCIKEGRDEHYACFCGKLFLDSEAETETTLSEIKLPLGDHIPGEAVRENEIPATEGLDGSYDSVVYCTECTEELSRTNVVVPATNPQANITLSVDDVHPQPGDIVNVTVSLETNYKVHAFQIMLSYDKNYYEVVGSPSGLLTNEPANFTSIVQSALNSSAQDEMYAGRYTTAEKAQFGLVRFGYTWLESLGATAPVMFDSATPVATLKLRVKDNAPEDGKGVIKVDPVFVPEDEEPSFDSRSATYVGRGTTTIYDSAINGQLYGNPIDVSGALFDGSNTVEGNIVIENEVPATCTSTGSYDKVLYCSCCYPTSELSRETITTPRLPHTPGEAVRENEIPATVGKEGSYYSAVYCTECKALISRTKVIIPALSDCATVTLSSDNISPAPGDIIDVTVSLKTTYPVYALQMMLAYDKTCYELVGVTGNIPSGARFSSVTDSASLISAAKEEEISVDANLGLLRIGYTWLPSEGATNAVAFDSDTAIATLKFKVKYGIEGKNGVIKVAPQFIVPGTVPSFDSRLATYVGKGTTTIADSIVNGQLYGNTIIANELAFTIGAEECKHTNVEVLPAIPADCVKTGLTEGKKCKDCGVVTVAQKPVPVTAHTEVAIPAVAATCLKTGLTEGKKCSVCGVVTVKQYTTAKLPHTEATRQENRVEATPTQNGSYDEVTYCTVCKEVLNREHKTIPATGHTFGAAVKENIKDSTCRIEGSYDSVVYCTCCNPKVELSRETKTIAKKPHTEATRQENRVDATPTEYGSYIEVTYCTVCYTELSRKPIIISPIGHTFGAAVEENIIDSTCKTEGSYDSVVYCTCCTPKVELSRETVTIAKKPHTEVIIPVRPATCTNTGLTAGKKCSVCGEVTLKQETVDKLPHTEESAVTPPTCTDKGYTTYTCTVCGNERVGDYVDANGHTPGKWVITKEPAVGVAGEETLYCSICYDIIETREIPAITAHFKEAEGSTTIIDKERGFIYGLEEYLYDLDGFVDFEGGTIEYVETNNGFGTGTVVNFIVNGEVYESYTIVIFGDVTGDGVVDTYDSATLAAVVNGDIDVEEGSAVALAGDLACDDGWIDTYDLVKIYQAVNCDIVISQVR